MKNLINLSIIETKKMVAEGVVIIDIRTPAEWEETGVVPNSHKLMYFDEDGNYNFPKWSDDLGKILRNTDDPIILICRTGNRTKIVGNFLLNQVGYEKVYHTQRGITGWINDGQKIVK